MINPAELLASIALDHLGSDAREKVMRKAITPTNRPYVSWFTKIDWHARVPGLTTWAGQQTLPKIIKKLQDAIKGHDEPLMDIVVPMLGATGFDPQSCQDAIDIGFSPSALDMPVMQRPGIELLAIYGMQLVAIVSYGGRSYGILHDEKLWRFEVEIRDGGYYKRWGYCDNPVELERAGWVGDQ